MSLARRFAELRADPKDREAMAYELAKRIANVRAARRLGVSEDELLNLIAGYLKRFPACRTVDNLLG